TTGALMVLAVALFTQRRGPDLVVAAISGSVVNGANMGFPIAAYVLGDISHALPVILFQQAVYTPLYLFVLHRVTSDPAAGPPGAAPPPLRAGGRPGRGAGGGRVPPVRGRARRLAPPPGAPGGARARRPLPVRPPPARGGRPPPRADPRRRDRAPR